VYYPVEGQQMVLTKGVDRDVASDHELVVPSSFGNVVRSNAGGVSSSA
jgi:hypothetical protein